jgi:hypothetical protein
MELVANPVISNVMVVRHLHHRSHGIRPNSKYIFLLSEQLAMIFREVVAPRLPFRQPGSTVLSGSDRAPLSAC